MTNPKKSNHYYKKYQKILGYNFYIFIYFPVSKSDFDMVLNENLREKGMHRLILPSAFDVVKEQKVQGPRISLIYSPIINFIQISNLYDITAISFKLKTKWYPYYLLNDFKKYEAPYRLCIRIQNGLSKHSFSLYQLSIK